MAIDRPGAIRRYLNAKSEYDEIKSNLDYQARRLLEVSGWKETSQTPGAVWMWQKTYPSTTGADVVYTVDQEHALAIEREEDDFAEAEDAMACDADSP